MWAIRADVSKKLATSVAVLHQLVRIANDYKATCLRKRPVTRDFGPVARTGVCLQKPFVHWSGRGERRGGKREREWGVRTFWSCKVQQDIQEHHSHAHDTHNRIIHIFHTTHTIAFYTFWDIKRGKQSHTLCTSAPRPVSQNSSGILHTPGLRPQTPSIVSCYCSLFHRQ